MDFGKMLIPALNAVAKCGRNLGEPEGELVQMDS